MKKSFRIESASCGYDESERKYVFCAVPDKNDMFSFRQVQALIESGKPLEAEVRERREKRSLDANSYCWVLLGKLAAALHLPRETIYRETIRDIGDNYELLYLAENAAESFEKAWKSKGIGWFVEHTGTALQGENGLLYGMLAYYGSSVYDTRQMSCLIDLLVQECQTFDIETRPQEEIQSLLEAWDAQEN